MCNTRLGWGKILFLVQRHLKTSKNSNIFQKLDFLKLNLTYFLRFWVPGPDRGFYENFQYVRGFLQLQDLVDRAILRATQEDLGVNSMVDIDEFGVYTQEIPYPCFTRQKYALMIMKNTFLV